MQGLGIVFIFGQQVLISNEYGISALGNFQIGYGFAVIVALFGQFGLGTLAMKVVASKSLASDYKFASTEISTVCHITVGLTFLLGMVASPYIEKYYSKDILLIVYMVSAGFFGLTKFNSQILRGAGRAVLAMACGYLMSPLVTVVALIVFSQTSVTASGALAWSFFIGCAVSYLISKIYVNRSDTKSFDVKSLNKEMTFSILEFSFIFWLVDFVTVMYGWVDVLIIGAFLESEELGRFSAALKSTGLIGSVLVALNFVIAPHFARAFAKDDLVALRKTFRFIVGIMVPFAGILAFVFIYFAEYILKLWGVVDDEATRMLRISTVGQIFNLLAGPSGVILLVSGHQKLLFQIVAIAVFVKAILLYMVVSRHGAVGAMVVTSTTMGIMNVCLFFAVCFVHPKVVFED